MSTLDSQRLCKASLLFAWILNGCSGSSHPGAYLISGSVNGLNSGAQVTLSNDGKTSVTVTENGPFVFAGKVPAGASYAVIVTTQPPAQSCVVTAGSGSNVAADISQVQVTCSPAAESLIHSFNATPDGSNPSGNLVKGTDGNLYGTTAYGGRRDSGTVFMITPTGTETVLHRFAGWATDGANPYAGLVQDADGILCGTTSSGGAANLGTVFKITPDGVETVLHSFAGVEGAAPTSGLVQASDGNFYGTTQGGGANGRGAVFKITPGGVETTIYSFAGGTTDGSNPEVGLTQGVDGSLYGVTYTGGASNNGTLFKVTAAGVETVLHSFGGDPAAGTYPDSALVQGSDGNFYGTTNAGGKSDGGTIFKMTPAGETTMLYSFASDMTDVAGPNFVTLGSDGNIYGCAARGGASGNGGIFKITLAGEESVMYTFKGASDGASPVGLIEYDSGNFYISTDSGGKSNSGMVAKLASGGLVTVLHDFNSSAEGSFPMSLVEDNGSLFVTTISGGPSGAGTLALFLPTGEERAIAGLNGGRDGRSVSGFIRGQDGNFYGAARYGGATGNGSVIKVTPSGTQTVLYSFAGSPDAGEPAATLVQASDGNFYGTSTRGGAADLGSVFRISPSGVETVIHSFTGTSDGLRPTSPMIQGSDGNLYGTTSAVDMTPQNGTIFKVTPSGGYTLLHAFAGGPTDGSSPSAALVQGSDGSFYGTTARGGAGDNGTFYKLSSSGAETVIASFSGDSTTGEGSVSAPLLQATDGDFYGITAKGGAAHNGSIFRMTRDGVRTDLYSFAGGTADGSHPGSMILAADGYFYGTTQSGGANDQGYGVPGAGTLFRY